MALALVQVQDHRRMDQAELKLLHNLAPEALRLKEAVLQDQLQLLLQKMQQQHVSLLPNTLVPKSNSRAHVRPDSPVNWLPGIYNVITIIVGTDLAISACG